MTNTQNNPDPIQAVTDVAETVGKTSQEVLETAFGEAEKLLAGAIAGTGTTLEAIADLPFLRQTVKFFKANWLLSLLGEVDVAEVEAKVNKFKSEYPQESESEIAHRLMVEQALNAGRLGLFTNLLPPFAAILFGVELAATTQMQAELVYQIAAAYNLDLKEPSRRGEVVTIFALAGGFNAVKLGLNFVEIIPGVGAFVGAASNAAMLYAVGYAAARFYEAKQGKAANFNPETIYQESEAFLTKSQSQQAIMNQVLVEMILAVYPDKTRADVINEIHSVHFPDSSVEAISHQIENPQPLELLIGQLEPDFVPPLLARCETIAQESDKMSPKAEEIIQALRARSS
ncbi:hypothetical protein [Oscillatoria salina]|uniref:hypothetical protein n=1 Tax=Oscillatoria salina TaxID=331517 RepID=UPI0013BE8392|nr:hypothetical protein [Oscillatoria salina]MBZ8178737.1 hypothetical protein [Oscillatoria salina IIICB1]NET89371.1 hypothetical protein [Kamptonema sp. SIO1D9]